MTRPSPTAELHALRRLLDAAEQSADPRLSMVYDAYEALRPRIQNAPLPDNELDLEGILGESTRRLFGCEEVTVTEVVWSRAEGTPFIHGAFKAHDRAASFLFFEDHRRGIVAVDRGEGMVQLGALRRRPRALDA